MPNKAKTTRPANTAPQAPLYLPVAYPFNVNGTPVGWPAKSASGNSIRAYCWQVASKLAAKYPKGFTIAQYAAGLAQYSKATNLKQPAAGWGTPAKPNSNAFNHANYFAGHAQQWLVPAAVALAGGKAKAPRKPRKAPAKAPKAPQQATQQAS